MKKLTMLPLLILCVFGLSAEGVQEGAGKAAGEPAPAVDPFVIGERMPDAPELAARGPYGVGRRSIEITDADRLDILRYSEESPDPRYDRTLKLELWYPAVIPEDRNERTKYVDYQHSFEPMVFTGRALQDAAPLKRKDGGYPLIVVSHGYPGTRLMMSYLTEHLASQGYVVAAISHPDSTVVNKKAFSSTLLNRPLDILFTIDRLAEMGREGGSGFLAGLVDAERTGLIGYSMGGYGAINAAGAGFSQSGVDLSWGVPGGHLKVRQAGNETFRESFDPRIKAIFTMAPWGAGMFWNQETMKGLEVPSFFAVGDQDDVALYEKGVKLFYDWAVNSDRYMLVVQNARHNIAPNAYGAHPLISQKMSPEHYMRYGEPAWDNRKLNNIMQHFATAFLGIHLKGEAYGSYLDLIPKSNEGVWSQNEDGSFKEDHTHWKGFPKRTALGLELYHQTAR